MIEIIYSDETGNQETSSSTIRLPRNVRQIGNGGENKKIYVEDYVMTFIGKIWENPIREPVVGILLGKAEHSEGITYLFVSGAIKVENVVQSGNGVIFSDETWTSIYETIKEYFNELEIIGWFLVRNDTALDVDESLYKTHVDNFAGVDKMLLLADVEEKEEEFYLFQNGQLAKQNGYYVYYEKNEPMQAYMVERKQGKTIEPVTEDKLTGNYRALIQEKKENTSQKKVVAALYSACTFLAVVVLAIGVTMMNNYDKMKNMEMTLNSLTQDFTGEKETETQSNHIPVNVTVDKVQGNVETTPESTAETMTTEAESMTEALKETEAPATEAAPTESKAADSSINAQKGTYHVVLEGETLTAISMAVYHTDTMVEKIKEANGIEDENKIYPGQEIYLP